MRLYADDVPDPDKDVSIHASVKDATYSETQSDGKTSFNPRICKRCDVVRIVQRLDTDRFQSTHL